MSSPGPTPAPRPELGRWQRLKDLVADALELPAAERAGFVRAQCGEDPVLQAEAIAMLGAANSAAADLLESPATLPAALVPLPPGERCGPYTIEALIGEGGFSEVYRARQLEPIARSVALKVLKPGMDSRAVLARFQLERRTLARLEHPGIARILDAGATAGGRPFVVVELVAGSTLQHWLDRQRPPLDQRLQLFLQIAAAVTHAHQRGVIHRDLKPSNVLIVDDGDAPRAVVIDFGIAKVLDGDDGPFTVTGQYLGTPRYSSPEQRLARSGEIDTRTDVYALGVMLAELVDGARTDAGGRATAMPRELGWIVARATADDRDRRYAGVAELAHDVQAYRRGELLQAGPPTLRYRVRTFARRHRLALTAGALVAVAIVTGAVLATVGYWRADSARREAVAARADADTTADYLARLLTAVSPRRQGRDVKVVDLLAASQSLLDRAADRPDVAARLHRVIGNAYHSLGSYAEAERHLRAAADSYTSRHGELDWRGIEVACELAGCLHAAGNLAAAAPLVDAVAVRARTARGDQHPKLRVLTDMQAKLAFDRGRPQDAEGPLRMLLALHETDGNHDGLISVAGNLSQVLLGLRRIDEARALAERALAHARQHRGAHHQSTFAAARKLAAVHLEAGDHAAMLRELEPLLPAARQRLGADHPDLLGMLLYHATALNGLRQFDAAEPVFRELVAAQQRKLDRLHPQAMMTLNNFGSLLRAKGDFAGAEKVLRDASERLAEARGKADPQACKSRYLLAGAIADQHRHREVAPSYAEAVADLLRALPAADPMRAEACSCWLDHLQALAAEQEGAGDRDGALTTWQTIHDQAAALGRTELEQRAAAALQRARGH